MAKPYYQSEGITIYHGDCRDVLDNAPECLRFDALVTDPPFGIGFDRADWSDRPEDYPALMDWLVGIGQKHVDPGWCFIFQTMLNVSKFQDWFPDGWRIFAACKNFAQIRPTGVWHSWDPVVFWANGAKSKPNRGPDSGYVSRDYHVGNVAGCLSDGNGHPCPRPLDTMRHVVCLAAPEGGIVVDPFMGSGTTLLAAKETGRKANGIEISEEYCEIAAKRLSQRVLDWGPADIA